MAAKPLMTAEDLAAMPDDGFRYELDRGVLIQMPLHTFRHGLVATNFGRLLHGHVKGHGLGVVGASAGFVLAREPDRVVAPDVFFIRADRLPLEDEEDGYPELAPDLVVEVVATTDTADYHHAKVLDELVAGVRLVVDVHPRQRTVTLWNQDRTGRLLTEADDLDGGDVLPDFRVCVADLFR
jgi:Uma2 family endonuclease